MTCYDNARQLIDEAHAADPTLTADGRPAELVYGERVQAWVVRLVPDASEHLKLAARCQHLERWQTPRLTFPAGKSGYLQWRRLLYVKQAERAREIMLAAGVPAAEADEAARWISKTDLKTDPGTQALQDAAVLVFLENEISEFAAQHAEYTQEKFIDIIRKTWRKLSPAGKTAALSLNLSAPISALVDAALAE